MPLIPRHGGILELRAKYREDKELATLFSANEVALQRFLWAGESVRL